MPDREWQERSDTDRREILERRQQWYTNKEIFEMVQNLRDELRETRDVVKKYNGIRDDLDWCVNKLETQKAKKEGSGIVLENIRSWGGWAIATLLAIMNLLNWLGVGW